MNKNVLTFIGLATTIVGMGINIISDKVDARMMDIKIEEKVAEALAKQLKN